MSFMFENLQVYQKAVDFAEKGIARGSAHECVPLPDLCQRRKLMPPSTAHDLKADLEEIAKMLSGLIRGLENRKT